MMNKVDPFPEVLSGQSTLPHRTRASVKLDFLGMIGCGVTARIRGCCAGFAGHFR